MNNLLYLTLFVPMLAIPLTLLTSHSFTIQRLISIIAAGVYSLGACYLLEFSYPSVLNDIQAGGWPYPVGIRLGYDGFSAVMVAVTGLIYFAASLYSLPGKTAENSKLFFPMFHALFFGLTGAFITQDLFNLFVWFEITLLSSFVLMSLENGKLRWSGTLKYVILSFVSSLIFLVSIALIYGYTHTLDFHDLALKLRELNQIDPFYTSILGTFLFCSFAIKSGLFPFYTWLPASYHHASPALSGVFAGLLTKLGLYAIFRVSNLVFPASDILRDIVLILAPCTMVFGVLGAITQNNIRRILSFHIISQVGYIVLASALISHPNNHFRSLGLIAALFYMVHHILVKTNLFFISGIIRELTGSESLKSIGGLRNSFPLLAILFAIPAMSLAGLPPSSGFWAKLSLIKTTIEAEFYFATAAMVLAGFFTLFSMIKIWNEAFWKDWPSASPLIVKKISKGPLLACIFLSFISLTIAIYPDYLMAKAVKAGATTSIEKQKIEAKVEK